MHLETAANVQASQCQTSIFLQLVLFKLEGITKHLITDPMGNSEFPLPPPLPRVGKESKELEDKAKDNLLLGDMP